MKKSISAITLSVLFAVLMAVTVFASTVTRAIPSVRIKINTTDVSIGSISQEGAMTLVEVPDNNYYTLSDASWVDDVSAVRIGDTPTVRVLLEAVPKEVSHSNYDLIYLFSGSYGKGNVTVTRGELLSAAVKDSGYFLELNIKVAALNGQLDMPASADWSNSGGVAVWTEGDQESGYHDIICYRGSTVVKKLTNYSGQSYNFYPYMTKSGDYKYRIRSVPNPATGVGKASEWLESGTLYITEDMVSDGTGQTTADENGGGQSTGAAVSGINYPEGTGNASVAGWIQQNGYTYFFYPNGEYARSEWLKLDGKWYMFDASGHLLKGWQKNKYGKWFYLDPDSGVMRTGWLRDGDKWYFLNTAEGDAEGMVVTGWLNWKNEQYYFNESGVMVTGWYKIDGSYRYFYPEGSTNGTYGYMARNTTVGGFSFDENGIWR